VTQPTIGFSALGPLDARRLFDTIALRLGPTLAVGLLAFGHTGEPLFGALSVVFAWLVSSTLVRSQLPIHLLPLDRILVPALAPAIGLGGAMLVESLHGQSLRFGELGVVLAGSWLVLLLGVWLVTAFDRRNEVRLAVLGPRELAMSLARELEASGVRGYRVCGWLSTGGTKRYGSQLPVLGINGGAATYLGELDEVRGAVKENGVDLLVNGPDPARDASDDVFFETVAAACLDLRVRMINGGLLYEELFGHVPLGTIDSAWFAYMLHPAYKTHPPFSKRALDVCLGTVMALVAAPVVAAAALAIKLSDRGPAFYRQRRVGEGGREFTMLKLRTMQIDAEADGPRLAEEDDERVTGIGRLLRRAHVDELPQLLNVLRGEMALVGPRPERGELVTRLEAQLRYFDRRHLIKPGITGWAQVSCGYAGTEAGVAWKLCHDLFYLKHRSLLTDLLILTETVRTVFADVQYGLEMPDDRFIVGGAAT
jgi:exopolysaccharide biosynthesis polyprenyl glycosylphosphotransferase